MGWVTIFICAVVKRLSLSLPKLSLLASWKKRGRADLIYGASGSKSQATLIDGESPSLSFGFIWCLLASRFPWLFFLGLIMRGHQHAGSAKKKRGNGVEWWFLPFYFFFGVVSL